MRPRSNGLFNYFISLIYFHLAQDMATPEKFLIFVLNELPCLQKIR